MLLIVDDTPKNIQIAANILSKKGYQIAFDEDGESALLHTKSVKIDLILLDIMMPGIDGYEVCRRLKDDPETKDIPVIFLTVKADTESIARGFDVGGCDYITKPFNDSELLTKISTHLELRQHRAHLEQMIKEHTESVKVLLEIRKEVSAAIKENVTVNFSHRFLPMLQTLKKTLTTRKQKECLNTIESELKETLSEFSQKLSCFNLTRTEMQVAGLIREGKRSKWIAEQLGVFETTVIFHRSNIRKKLGLSHIKKGLKSFLHSI